MGRVRERPGGMVLHTERMDHLVLHDHRVLDIPLGQEDRVASRGPGGELAVHLEAVPRHHEEREIIEVSAPASEGLGAVNATGSGRRRSPAAPPAARMAPWP
jgi:hypothetical protein